MGRKARGRVLPLEGACYAVPLPAGGFGIVVLARYSRRASPLGYFFGPRLSDPHTYDLKTLKPSDAIAIRRFAEVGIKEGRWKQLGVVPEWNRTNWPVPAFRREDLLANADEAQRYDWVVYYDDDAVDEVKDKRVKAHSIPGLVPENLMGEAALVRQLDEKLGGSTRDD